MRLLPLTAVVIGFAVSFASARTWHISPDSTGDAPTIQAGIDSAVAGDTVMLADGTYAGDGNRDISYNGKPITVRSASGDPNLCVIDCGGSETEHHRGFYLHSGEGADSRIEGVTVTNGYVQHVSGDDYWDDYGGGVLCVEASPTVVNVIFRYNIAWLGGGMACFGEPVLRNVVFDRNRGNERFGGGGLHVLGPSVTLNEVRFDRNVGGSGGGMTCELTGLNIGITVTLTDVVFTMNVAAHDGGGMFFDRWGTGVCFAELRNVEFHRNRSGWSGGGVYLHGGGDSTSVLACLTDVMFSGNTAGRCAGGMYGEYAAYTLVDVLFSDNVAENSGGGLYCGEGSDASLERVVFSANDAGWFGGGMLCGGPHSPVLRNVTFSGNSGDYGGGIYCDPHCVPVVENTIIAYSAQGEGFYCEPGAPIPDLRCCAVYGNAEGDWVGCLTGHDGINGNFSACPSFCHVDMGDFHLCDESPCLPGNHPDGYDCGLIGARGMGCSCGPTATEPTSWGAIKSMYR